MPVPSVTCNVPDNAVGLLGRIDRIAAENERRIAERRGERDRELTSVKAELSGSVMVKVMPVSVTESADTAGGCGAGRTVT